MRQRFLSATDATGFSAGVDVLSQRPTHARLAMETIANTALIERHRGWILASALGTKFYYAMTIFELLRTQHDQAKAIARIAKEVLSEPHMEILDEIESKCKEVFKVRNKFAHSTWGLSDKYPDDILCIPGRGFLDSVIEKDHATHFLVQGWVDFDRIEVFSISDLNAAAEASRCAYKAYSAFQGLLNASRETDDALAGTTVLEFLGRDFYEKITDNYTSAIEEHLDKVDAWISAN